MSSHKESWETRILLTLTFIGIALLVRAAWQRKAQPASGERS